MPRQTIRARQELEDLEHEKNLTQLRFDPGKAERARRLRELRQRIETRQIAGAAPLPVQAPEEVRASDESGRAQELQALRVMQARAQGTRNENLLTPESAQREAVAAGRQKLMLAGRAGLGQNLPGSREGESFASFIGAPEAGGRLRAGREAAESDITRLGAGIAEREARPTLDEKEIQRRIEEQAALAERQASARGEAQGLVEEDQARQMRIRARQEQLAEETQGAQVRTLRETGAPSAEDQLKRIEVKTAEAAFRRSEEANRGVGSGATPEAVGMKVQGRELSRLNAGLTTNEAYDEFLATAMTVLKDDPNKYDTLVAPKLARIAEVSSEEASDIASQIMGTLPDDVPGVGEAIVGGMQPAFAMKARIERAMRQRARQELAKYIR